MVSVSPCCKAVIESADDGMYPVDRVCKNTSATRNIFALFNNCVLLFERFTKTAAQRSFKALAGELGRTAETLTILKVVYGVKELVSGEAIGDNPFGKGINIPRLLASIFSLSEDVFMTVDWLSEKGVLPRGIASARFGSIGTFNIGCKQVGCSLGILSGSFGLIDSVGQIRNEGKRLTVNTLLKTVINTTIAASSALFLVATPLCVTLGFVVASIGITSVLTKFLLEQYTTRIVKAKLQERDEKGRSRYEYQSVVEPVVIADQAKKAAKKIEGCRTWIQEKWRPSEKTKLRTA